MKLLCMILTTLIASPLIASAPKSQPIIKKYAKDDLYNLVKEDMQESMGTLQFDYEVKRLHKVFVVNVTSVNQDGVYKYWRLTDNDDQTGSGTYTSSCITFLAHEIDKKMEKDIEHYDWADSSKKVKENEKRMLQQLEEISWRTCLNELRCFAKQKQRKMFMKSCVDFNKGLAKSKK